MVCFLSIFASKGVWRIQILRRGAQWRERMESGCVGGLCECNWWTCVRRNRSVGRRGIFWSYHFFLIICKASLWPRKALYKYYVLLCTKYLLFFILLTFTRENASKRTKKSTYAPALAHIKLLDSLFKAGTGHDHYPEWESSGIIPARAIPSAHRTCAVAFAPSSKWTMGVLRAF